MIALIAILLISNPTPSLTSDCQPAQFREKLSTQQAKQLLLVISDTTYRSGSRRVHALAVNSSFPPKFIIVSTGNLTTLTFSNNTAYELTVDVPALMNATGKPVKQKLLPQQHFSISLNVTKTGISSYRIYRFEQKGPPAIGSVVVEYPKTL